ncbi:uncharacterized membrane protein-like, partial [Condylostylus longicornis]|uniref:uncharacterized membrane protein-like n=1 Tax=Condylostylus longicornis TaxID=2530218 RepID=UPI00244DA08E
MKSDVSFRKRSKSYEQFSNEILFYRQILPYYEKILSKSLKESSIDVKNWVAPIFYAEFGLIQGLSDGKTNESVLVLENLKSLGYRGGPKFFLDRQQLLLSIGMLAEYHAFSYAMKINKDRMLQEFIEKIIPLPFKTLKNTTQQSKTIDYSIQQHRKLNEEKMQNDKKKQEIGVTNNMLEVDVENVIKNQNVLKRKFPTDVNHEGDVLNFTTKSCILSANDKTDDVIKNANASIGDGDDDEDQNSSNSNMNDDANRKNENKNEKNVTIDNQNGNNLYEIFYRNAFDRFFMFIEKLKIIKSNNPAKKTDQDIN